MTVRNAFFATLALVFVACGGSATTTAPAAHTDAPAKAAPADAHAADAHATPAAAADTHGDTDAKAAAAPPDHAEPADHADDGKTPLIQVKKNDEGKTQLKVNGDTVKVGGK